MIPLRDINPNVRPPLTTVALIGANVLAFVYELSVPPEAQEAFFLTWGLVPTRFLSGDPGAGFHLSGTGPTFLTSMFLHGGWMHLIGNMWSLWLFGDNVEDRMGHARFLVFYLIAGLAAAATHLFLNAGSPVPTIGASGAIAGVMGAYLVLFPGARILTLMTLGPFVRLIELPAMIYLGLWGMFQFFSGAMTLSATRGQAGGIAFWAHVGGFVAGLVLLKLFDAGPPRQRR